MVSIKIPMNIYFSFFTLVLLISTLNYDVIYFEGTQVSLEKRTLWGYVSFGVDKYQNVNLKDDIFISKEIVLSGDVPVEFYGLRINGLDKSLNDRIFDRFKSTDRYKIEKFEGEFISVLETNGMYSFRYNLLDPFAVFSVVALVGGFLVIVIKRYRPGCYRPR